MDNFGSWLGSCRIIFMRQDLYCQMYNQEEYYWWHKAKRNLVHRYIKGKNLKILDIGCGTGKLLEELQPYGKVYGLDANPQALKFCRKRHLRYLFQGHFPQIPNINHQFDVIICLDVLEHIGDDQTSFQVIRKLLKPSGFAIITVPAYPWLFSYWDKILGHQRRYGKKDLKRLAKLAKLKVIKLSYLYSFLVPLGIPFRLIRQITSKNQTPSSDFINLPSKAHQWLLALAKVEHHLLKYINLPFGLSLFCILKKYDST